MIYSDPGDYKEFKKQFVTTFVASWCANEHTRACMEVNHDKLYEPPYEDAELIADEVWQNMKKAGL